MMPETVKIPPTIAQSWTKNVVKAVAFRVNFTVTGDKSYLI